MPEHNQMIQFWPICTYIRECFWNLELICLIYKNKPCKKTLFLIYKCTSWFVGALFFYFCARHQRLINQFKNQEAKHRNERLSVNDCFLRNMHKYEYIANLDVDEVILPRDVSTWSEMMKIIKKQTQNKKVKFSIL